MRTVDASYGIALWGSGRIFTAELHVRVHENSDAYTQSQYCLVQYFSRSATQFNSLKILSTCNPSCASPDVRAHQRNLLALLLFTTGLLLGCFLVSQRHGLDLRNDIVLLKQVLFPSLEPAVVHVLVQLWSHAGRCRCNSCGAPDCTWCRGTGRGRSEGSKSISSSRWPWR
jgi:hypothetical protein